MNHPRALVAAIALTSLAPGAGACVQPECSSPDYGNPECRVIAENEFARLRTETGVELRFQQPDARTAESWIAGGLLREREPGTIEARVAGPGSFALSLQRAPGQPASLTLVLDNVDPAAHVAVGATEVPASGGLQRTLAIDLDDDAPLWIRSWRDCPARFRLAVAADIQTNPLQFERIVARLGDEHRAAEAAGEPLLGLLIAGDLAENSREDEFETVAEILSRLPIPTAVVPGNHDVYRPLHPLFNRRFGPGNYALEVCDVHVAMLDTGSGAIARSVQARLPELLDRGDARHLLAVMHHPPYAGITGAGWTREDLAEQALVEFAAAGVDRVLAGHAHALHDFPAIDIGGTRVHETIVGTAGAYQGVGVPRYGYLRLRFDGDVMDACFVEVPPPGLEGPAGEPLRSLEYCVGD
ncbi:MAG: metallophosphoesterase [Nannocystaceae bacterium]|nr:metallophosphoesterase [Nannocystaceae bacterium]